MGRILYNVIYQQENHQETEVVDAERFSWAFLLEEDDDACFLLLREGDMVSRVPVHYNKEN